MPKALPVGSKRINHHGYVQIKTCMGQRRWPFEHRVVWEKEHGPIPQGHVIHHTNHNPADNRLSNLQICESNSKHFSEHHRKQMQEAMRLVGLTGRGKKKSALVRANIAAGLRKAKAQPLDIQEQVLALRKRGESMASIAEIVLGSRSKAGVVLRVLRLRGDVIPVELRKNANWRYHSPVVTGSSV